jgi:hypothetical protein
MAKRKFHALQRVGVWPSILQPEVVVVVVVVVAAAVVVVMTSL